MTDQQVADPKPQRMTRQELVSRGIDAIDAGRSRSVAISDGAGGIAFADMMQVMEFARMMSVADKAVPPFLRGNPGACLAVTLRAVEWRMSPFAVAEKSYEVNDRIAYESQLVHAVVESRAPLKNRLRSRYEGEGAERRCIVWGTFVGESEPHEYESPPLSKCKKKSPLWTEDPDQQLFYYASRAWARRHCPEVLLGIYTKEEMQENPALGREEEDNGVFGRLAGRERPEEGFQDGHAERELANIAPNAGAKTVEALATEAKGTEAGPATQPQPEKSPAKKTPAKGRSSGRRTGGAPKGSGGPSGGNPEKEPGPEGSKVQERAERDQAAAPGNAPKTADDYVLYAQAWIAKSDERDQAWARWEGERELRDELSVPLKTRRQLEDAIRGKFPEEA